MNNAGLRSTISLAKQDEKQQAHRKLQLSLSFCPEKKWLVLVEPLEERLEGSEAADPQFHILERHPYSPCLHPGSLPFLSILSSALAACLLTGTTRQLHLNHYDSSLTLQLTRGYVPHIQLPTRKGSPYYMGTRATIYFILLCPSHDRRPPSQLEG